ncbi:hypothetical protein [Sphingomonas sp.]|uniref:hypothetical protein n=1 Tax=Sphingomonas sp. TaxID=28214 RepID=UPI003B3B7B42
MRPTILLLSLLLAGCKYFETRDVANIQDAEQAVTSALNDPASAQFRNVQAFPKGVCGEVNAKNGFGGYVGFRRFIYRTHPGKELLIQPMGGPGASNEDNLMILAISDSWDAVCKAG